MALADFFDANQEMTLPAGQFVLHQGSECQHYFLLVSGSVRVFTRSASGREVVLYHITGGNICILTTTCLLANSRFPAEAEAETDLVVRMMSRRNFDQLMHTSSAFREEVFASFAGRIGHLIGTIEKLALENLETRLVKFLLAHDAEEISLTHQAVAAEVGSAREVVSRHLKRLEQRGLVALGRNRIRLLDRQALEQLIQVND